MSLDYHQENLRSMDGENKGSKSYISHIDDGFSIGVIVAFSDERIYGVMCWNVTTDSSIFWYFLSQLYKENLKEFSDSSIQTILVMDNAPYHKSKIVQYFIKNSRVSIITITPYCPCLNPAEKIIMWIKQKLKRQQWMGRYDL